MRNFIMILLIAAFTVNAVADEGMWVPLLLGKYKVEDMQSKGFRLTAEDIYSVNRSSMKDAVVLFGRGCTGAIISGEGLLITNHHCGYGTIQSHSTIEHNYLEDGFWAYGREQELPNPRLRVSILVKMEDVTSKILDGVNSGMTEQQRQVLVQNNIKKLKKNASDGKNHSVEIKPFYYGNEYYLFVYKVFRDVRLVGAPPSSIGKFGGDTDNWMWPRHTGDFSLFRIYAGADNEPADYSHENVPYKPDYFFPISTSGINAGDFTMVFGFPGHTQEYIPSYNIGLIQNVENPHQISLRDARLKILKNEMDKSQKIRLQYSSKYAGIANYWKKWEGENRGLKRLEATEQKKSYEARFQLWADNHAGVYKNLLNEYKMLYGKKSELTLIETYLYEGIMSAELLQFSGNFRDYKTALSLPDTSLEKSINTLKSKVAGFYKDLDYNTDLKIFAEMMRLYNNNVPEKYHPELFIKFKNKFRNNWEQIAVNIYSKSAFRSKEHIISLLENFRKKGGKTLEKDPLLLFWADFADMYNHFVYPFDVAYNVTIDSLNRVYMKARMEYDTGKLYYPDANLTLRVTYGKVSDYKPADGVYYFWQTTLEGIIEKEDTSVYDYMVPARLKELWQAKDYGNYGINGTVPVCFIASNHTTGGNSGSPVLNGNGELIGINFDRNWEGTMSDLMYDPEQCRNITLDIRYALFIIDKFANAGHLVNEMKIIAR